MSPLTLLSEQEESALAYSPVNKRNSQKIRIIKYLHQHGSKSIPELCSVARVSSPTLKQLLVELMDEGLVLEIGLGFSGGGRRPSLYDINPDSRLILGMDITRNQIYLGLFNLKCEVIGHILTLPEGLESHPHIMKYIKAEINKLFKKQKVDRTKVLGVGVAIPGLIDMKTGISYSYFHNEDIPVQQQFRDELQLPVFIEHDTRAMARGEMFAGQAAGKQNVLCLNLGTGIGLSMILNGKLYQGVSGYAGEFGHINVDPDGGLCHCGKIGCLETLASAKTIKEKARNDIEKGTKSLIWERAEKDLSKINLITILDAATAGDQYAISLLNEAGLVLGKAIATLIHLYNPELIILGGMMAQARSYLTDPINQNINKFCIPRMRNDTRIVVSEMQPYAGIMGTVALVMDQYFEPRT